MGAKGAAETMLAHRYSAVDGTRAQTAAPVAPDPRSGARAFASAADHRYGRTRVKAAVPPMTIGAHGAPIANDLTKWVVVISGVDNENFRPLNALALQSAMDHGCEVSVFSTLEPKQLGWIFS